ncbi:MAG TPA: FHA domain-containing protein [Kofleriaceae bacterium]|nr:FHA domain-containing protein [Kofleriaceae bacterium]
MGPSKTIGIELWGGQTRGASNVATCYRPAPRVNLGKPMRQLFLGAYGKFADLCREVDEPGLALLAVDESTGAPAGLVRLRARVGRHVAAIVGRHDQCDLYLSEHASLALRHLAIVLDPVQSWRRNSTSVRYRVLDLRTSDGFTDENGKPMRGLRAEGPAFIRCAGHALFVLPLGDPTDWPENPADAWSMLPERIYFDEMRSSPDGSLTNMPLNASRKSMIFRTHGVRDTGTGESLIDRGDLAGTLDVIGATRSGRMTIGDRALRDGVLLGRYARCDGAELLEDLSMSRVHMLLLHTDDALLAVDTCSRNGSHLPGHSATRVISVSAGTEIHLGKHTRIRWRWTA